MNRHFVLGFLLLAGLSTVPRPVRGDEAQGQVLPPALTRILFWLPENTETLVVARSFPIPSFQNYGAACADPALLASDIDRLNRLSAMEGLCDLGEGKYLEAAAGKNVALALRGARNFDMVGSFGSRHSEGCGVVVFENDQDQIAQGWVGMLRDGAKEVRQMAGRDVFVFPSTTEMELWIKPKSWQGTFITLLRPNTVLCATSDRYLEGVLKRMEAKPVRRALDDGLPEWKQIDLNSPSWLLRHISGSAGRRIVKGLTLSGTKGRFSSLLSSSSKFRRQGREANSRNVGNRLVGRTSRDSTISGRNGGGLLDQRQTIHLAALSSLG